MVVDAEEMVRDWGFWEKRDMRVADLSYGDQRLVDIMLAMARKPRLLLLDEPTSGLALAEIETVISRINGLSRDITFMLIEHNMDVALNLADTISVLHMGRLVAEGSPEAIQQNSQVQDIYLGVGK